VRGQRSPQFLGTPFDGSAVRLYPDILIPTAKGTAMTPPETRYARSGDVRIAYQVVGDGPLDLVFVPGFISNLDLVWESAYAHFFTRLAAFSRLILFDKRGTGLSDRMAGIANLEERMDDVRAVMDSVGSERAALFGMSEGGPMSLLFGASYPERARARIVRQLCAPPDSVGGEPA
jgi:pimeloyl-ACP methyl ester carboxylesterase